MDPISFFLFFFVFAPFILIHMNKHRKAAQELIELQKETNRLLAEIVSSHKSGG
jgi:hypothetical protein